MASLARSLDILITARYHGSVLALPGLRPQIGFGHDLRLKILYQELGLYEDYFIDAHEEGCFELLNRKVERLLAQPDVQLETLRRGYQDQLARARMNRELLARFLSDHGWGTAAWAA
jgi:polysaccharide pyruvyl transferase WcaK-like protein